MNWKRLSYLLLLRQLAEYDLRVQLSGTANWASAYRASYRVLDTRHSRGVAVKIRQLSRRRDGQLARGSRTRRIRDGRCAGPPRDNWRGRVSVCMLHSGSIISTPVRVRCCPAICFALSLRHNYSVDRTLRESMNFCFLFLSFVFLNAKFDLAQNLSRRVQETKIKYCSIHISYNSFVLYKTIEISMYLRARIVFWNHSIFSLYFNKYTYIYLRDSWNINISIRLVWH